jgi:AraC-like DNA-binding protein
VPGRINRTVAALVVEGLRAQMSEFIQTRPELEALDGDEESVSLDPYRALLDAAVQQGGRAVLLRAGQSLRGLRHPLLFVLLNSDSPLVLIEKEERLARFIHSRHRVVVETSSGEVLMLRHVSQQEEQPDPLEDLAAAGQHIALLSEIGCRGLRLRFPESQAPNRWVYREPDYEEPSPGGGYYLWQFEWETFAPTRTPMQGLDEILLGSTKQSPVAEDVTWCDKVDHVLRHDLSRTWRLSKVAEVLGLSPRTLQRELGKTGETFTDLVDRVRTQEAARLLEQSELSVTEIGFACGFADTAHFSRRFKERYGAPPSVWRKGG